MIFFQVFALFLMVVITLGVKQLEEGESCFRENTGEKGTCKRLSECPVALAAVKYDINPQLCGIYDKHAIVCCLHSTDEDRSSSSPSRRNKKPEGACPSIGPLSGTIGESCETLDGKAGKCLLLGKCPAVVKNITKRNGKYKKCFMVGTIPVVCCGV